MRTEILAAGTAAAVAYALFGDTLRKYLRRATSAVKLTYFNIDGLGEPIRLTLACAGVAFEDYRFANRDEFMALKPSLRFGQVPCLTADGAEIVQSAAAMRFVARAYDTSGSLYPTDLETAALVDALIDQAKDMLTGRLVFRYKDRFWGSAAAPVLTDKAVETIEAAWLTEVLPRHFDFFSKALSASPTPWLAATPSPTIADLFLATQLAQIAGYGGKLPADLQAFVARLYAVPAVAAWKSKEC